MWAVLCYNVVMVTILDYGAGNLTSVRLAFERLGVQPRIITAAHDYAGGRIVFPGVGSAGSGMRGVCERGFDALLRRALAENIPTLGVCLGMQLLGSRSEEDGGIGGLGLISGDVRRFDGTLDPTAKIPHMGWNTVTHIGHPLFAGIAQEEAFYFVHSYFMQTALPEETLAAANYCGATFAAAIGKGSLVATQFHPERSGAAGAKLLQNFLSWEGVCS